MAQGFLLFFLCGPLSHIHLRINISQRVKVITSTNTWHHRSAKEHIPLKFQLYSSFKTQRRNDCTKSGSRVLTFPYIQFICGIFSTYFISNLSYYISNIYFEYFELILELYLVVYIYPIYMWYIFDLFYFEFIVLYIEYIAYFEYFELILGLYLVVYIYPIYMWYIFDLFYFEFIVLYIEYIFRIFRTYFRAVFGRIYISNLYVLYFRLILFRIYRTIYRIYISNISNLF